MFYNYEYLTQIIYFINIFSYEWNCIYGLEGSKMLIFVVCHQSDRFQVPI